MDIPSLDMDLGGCRVEVLELQLTDLASVHSVGIISPELPDVKLHHPSSDFLVGSESNLDVTVLIFRISIMAPRD